MNIYDIAQLAGVSIATVSRVMNDSPMVSEKTKAKVRAVMEENDYIPNIFAQALGRDSMQTIGLICPDVSDAYMAKAVAFLESNLRACGYDCILYCSGNAYEDRQQAVNTILQKRMDGLIVIGSVYSQNEDAGESGDYLRQAAQKIPVFLLNAYIRDENIYCTLCNDSKAACEAVQQLIRSGHQKVLFLSDSHSLSANLKLQGYQAALQHAGLVPCPEMQLYVPNRIAEVCELLLSKPELDFDAVFATDDGLAVGVLKYAKAKGLAVPKDLSVIGYNNFEISIACEPELSTVDSGVEELCRSITDSMMRLMKKEKIPHTTYVDGKFIQRATTMI